MKKLFLIFLMLCAHAAFGSGIGTTATAPCDNDTLSKYNGTANVEINWEPNVIQLGWYDGDTKLNVQNSSQSCTYDGMVTVPPQPTRPGYTFNGWKVIRVPDGFTELEYIESTGTQYIDTGISDIVDSEFGIVAQQTEIQSSGFSTIVGAQEASGSYKVVFAYSTYNTGKDEYFYTQCGTDVGYIYGLPRDLNKHTFRVINTTNSQTFIMDNHQPVTGQYNITNTTIKSLTIFARNYYSGMSSFAKQRVFSFYAKKHDVLIQNLIPAKRNSDNVLGMWDSVSGQFFTNSGTGTFTAGPAVQ